MHETEEEKDEGDCFRGEIFCDANSDLADASRVITRSQKTTRPCSLNRQVRMIRAVEMMVKRCGNDVKDPHYPEDSLSDNSGRSTAP